MNAFLKEFLTDEAAAVSLEYAMIGSLISIGIVAACLEIGASVNTMFSDVAAGFTP